MLQLIIQSLNYFKQSDIQKNLKILLDEYYADDIGFEILESNSAPTQTKSNKREDAAGKKSKIGNNPVLKDALDVFGGRVVSINPKK